MQKLHKLMKENLGSALDQYFILKLAQFTAYDLK
jgi:hypothetical protein